MKMARCWMMVVAACLVGCGPGEGKIIIQNGSDTRVATGYQEVVCAEQGFATKCLDCYASGWVDGDGFYIYVGKGTGIPYVLIWRNKGVRVDPAKYLDGQLRREMAEQYGENLLESGELKMHTYGEQTVPGVLFTYKVGDAVVKSQRLALRQGDDLVLFNAKYVDGSAYAHSTMDVLKAAVENYRTTEGTAAGPAGTDKLEQPAGKAAAGKTAAGRGRLDIKPAEAASVTYERYADPSGYFTMEIPKGWRVRTGLKPRGELDLISYAISVFDPKKPDRELYFNLNAALGVKSQAAHDWYVRAYGPANMFAQMPVVAEQSTAGFFAAMGPLYGYRDFHVMERLGKTPMGGEAVVARCVSQMSGAALQGLFHAVVTSMSYLVQQNPMQLGGPMVDAGPLSEYVILSEVTPEEEFVDWQPVLDHCLGSIVFTAAFQRQRQQAWAQLMGTVAYQMHTADAISGMIMDSYERRNATYDVLSQKRSDATLGYERVLDTETGDYYRAENGFSDWYDGQRYQPVDDDKAYLTPVSGYINWK